MTYNSNVRIANDINIFSIYIKENMFYCVYCEKDKEHSIADIHYKQSIKCADCAKNFATRKPYYIINCECGVVLKSTGRMRHFASVVHKRYINSLL